MNTINLIKGFLLMFLGFIGVRISQVQGYMNIRVTHGSISWYLLEGIPALLIMIGLYKIYQFLRIKFKKHHEEIITKNQ